MLIPESLEQQFNFRYPAIYRELYADNMLDSGPTGPEWLTNVFPRLREKPPLLLFGSDFELLAFEEIAEQISAFSGPDDYRRTRPDLRLIPFGQSGAGDLYCFYLNEQQGADVPIAFVWHDMNEAEIKAKNLPDFIFRALLEAVVDVYEEGLIMLDSFKENSTNMLRTHRKYLPVQQQKVVEEIYSRELFEYQYQVSATRTETATGLLTYTELADILAREIAFDKLDATFPYQLD
ncbi:MAG: SMI1/KNR4 family protein [Janthinobacterium lividum]